MTERLQLRDWLLTLLVQNQTPGLEWIDKDQQIFAISWRHGRKKGWRSETDSQLFKEWAIYKKRYEPGNDKQNAKLWKSRFRCALNALNDVRELKKLSKTKGDDARKIYQFFQKPPVVTDKTRRRFPRADKTELAKFNFKEQEHCYNKIDMCQERIPCKKELHKELEEPVFRSMCTDHQYMNSEGWQYIFHQISQELQYKIPDLFCNLDEDDFEANKTIEELLSPKCRLA